ncbi:hypothetical protein JL193_01055 [Polaribacter batillariae]|uniref:DUF3566 domain-containing protein n=1 Tax=Polaribacter batillariae TaxID=2808900 RepID=A0ABX7SWT4_9FLAO|nr:hypothetical protein [Polaribacter batillariae]QTD37928.1 hypothetical protein JL193_01055 [Polaribacter batillariae]
MSNLKLKLKKVDATKYGIIVGSVMALLTFIIIFIGFLFTSLIGFGSGIDSGGLSVLFGGGIFMVILAPIMYFVTGFIFGWIGCMLLNFILKKTGGLDIEFEKSGFEISEIGKE